MTASSAARMPVLFAGHGNPMNAILDNKWSQGFRHLGELVPRPKAILAVSAHWYVPGTYLMGNHDPKTIHDFGGFPRELYEVQYPAPGAPGLAEDASHLLAPWQASVRSDWGLDHGTWSVLRHMYPKADIPVVQLSIDGHAPIQSHWDIGQALRPLRDQGVLIVGSGNLVHNLRSAFAKMRAGVDTRESWATEFDERTASSLQNLDRAGLEQACATTTGHLAHPLPDHYIPILYAAGAAGRDADVSFPVEGFDMGDISMRAVLFD